MRAKGHIRPYVNGQTLRLQPFNGTPDEYSRLLNAFWIGLTGLAWHGCEWQRAPQLFRALSQMKEEFLRTDVPSDLQLERSLGCSGAPKS